MVTKKKVEKNRGISPYAVMLWSRWTKGIANKAKEEELKEEEKKVKERGK